MHKKLAPKWVSMQAPPPGADSPSPVEGVDNLPLPMGVNRQAVRQAEQDSEGTPGAMGNPMTSAQYSRECNGDNPSIKDTGLQSGADVRKFGSSPSSNPSPAMPGA
jgi:hypothetical protein